MKIGKHTIRFEKPIYINDCYSIVGKSESEGAFGKYFNQVMDSYEWGESSFEKTECKMQKNAIRELMNANKINDDEIDLIISGDLLNQIAASSYAAREFNTAFMGAYTACSTIAEAMLIASNIIVSNNSFNIICATSSHFCSAERYYRYPLELGTPKTPLSQWTVTAAASFLLSGNGIGPKITAGTFGQIIDYGISDASDMGAAMAPAAVFNIVQHFRDTNTTADNYDMIITGDLGKYGSDLFRYLLKDEGYTLGNNYFDCGAEYYGDDKRRKQGGSGAGCCSSVLASFIYQKLKNKEWNKVLFMPTGALLSKDSSLQGESIPAIAQIIVLES